MQLMKQHEVAIKLRIIRHVGTFPKVPATPRVFAHRRGTSFRS